jgi:hypothetical protein
VKNDDLAATERIAAPARFVRIIGWLFLGGGGLGLLISGAQVVLLSDVPPGLADDRRARAVAFGLVAVSCIVVVAAVAFLRRRPWARVALSAITVVGIVANLAHLLVPAEPIEPPPPEAPPDYARLLRLISIADVVLPVVACLALAWILWRLRSPAVRDQFR